MNNAQLADGIAGLRQLVMRMRQLVECYGSSRSTFMRMIDEGTFPPLVPVNDRGVGALVDEVEAVVRARAAGATKEELRELVAKLVAARQNWRNPSVGGGA